VAKSFVVRSILGLGITSVTDFVRLMGKYKVARDAGIDYVTAATFTLPKKKNLLVFDSVKQVIRFSPYLKPDMVIVVSDTPVILKEIAGIIPLDYSNERSFEFNFKEIDPHEVLRVLKSNKTRVDCKLVSHDNLGYHVNRIKGTGELLNSYVALTSSMPFDKRSVMREATVKFFTAKKANVTIITDAITKIGKNYAFGRDIDSFLEKLNKQYKDYFDAVVSKDAAAIAAKKHNVDAYAVSYFRKIMLQKTLNDERIRKHNVEFKQSKTA